MATPGDGMAVGRLAAIALEHTPKAVQKRARPGRDLVGYIEKRGGIIRTRHGHTICRVATDHQHKVIGMIHVGAPLDWIEDHPMGLRPALGRAVTEIGMLAVDAGHQGQGVGASLLAAVEADERERGTDVLFAKVAWSNWDSLQWYRKQGFIIAAPGADFLLYTPTERPASLTSTTATL
ncbi:hypothetical protein CG740_35095 [Streptomyces sp. CB01201]|nr:hypothetical protein CG740_35095 [Streptomyces sp. CB01201]